MSKWPADKKNCGNCLAWDDMGNDGEGYCSRYPPLPVAPDWDGKFPVTNLTWWCCQWLENKAEDA